MKFGIIGGNGVAATNRLLHLIERKLTKKGAYRDQHHPEMIVWQATQAPSRSMYLEGRGPSFVDDYVRIAGLMRECGVKRACMCCNTAHHCIDEVQQKSGVSFINLLEEVALRAMETGENKFELFVTDGARKFKLYDKAFSKIFPKATLVYPDDTRQALVTRVISGVKTSDRFLPSTDANSPFAIVTSLLKSSQYPVIFGCTDIRVAYPADGDAEGNGGCLIDSLETLALSIIRESGKEFVAYGE